MFSLLWQFPNYCEILENYKIFIFLKFYLLYLRKKIFLYYNCLKNFKFDKKKKKVYLNLSKILSNLSDTKKN